MGLINMLFGSSTTDNNKKQFDYSKLEKIGYTSKPKTVQEIVEEIHHSFNTAANKALEEANRIIGNAAEIDPIIDQMRECGFSNVSKVKKGIEEKQILKLAKEEAELITYYQQTYPVYKFITKKQIQKICEKYGLVWGKSNRYKGDIPYKSMHEISTFKIKNPIKEEDCVYYKEISHSTYIFPSQYSEYEYQQEAIRNGYTPSITRIYKDTTFTICAPVNDMDMTKAELKDHKIVDIPDPVVLYPVRGGMYCIVSAWGPEASDEYVVNQKMN